MPLYGQNTNILPVPVVCGYTPCILYICVLAFVTLNGMIYIVLTVVIRF